MSNKEVCSEYLHNVSSNYQQRISEWGERKHASATADKSSANMQECAGKPQSQHTSMGRRSTNGRQNVARTHCVLPKQNSMYLRQFLIINKNILKMFVGENLMNVIKNGPLPKVKCRGRPFIASSSLSTSDEVHLHPWELL